LNHDRRARRKVGRETERQDRPEKIYAIGTAEIKDWKKYEKIWQEAFKLR